MRSDRDSKRRPARSHGGLAWSHGTAPFLALLLLLSACSGGPEAAGGAGFGDAPGRPRLVVLYSTCTLTKEYLSPYHPEVEFTPNLQAFADEGLVFDRHNTEAGQSGVAFASIYTGVQADRHGVYHHPRHLPESLYLATEAFRDGGYRPYFWSGQPLASAELGYGQGVRDEDVVYTHVMFTPEAKDLPERFFVETTANGPELDPVLQRLVDHPDTGAFLQINFTITHELYHEYANIDKVEAFRAAFPERTGTFTRAQIEETLALFEEHRHELQMDFPGTVARLGLSSDDIERIDGVLRIVYMACVHQLDDYLGEFLGKLRAAGLLDTSLIAFTADHGETFYHASEPFHWMHGLQLAPSVIEVPWILRAPGLGIAPGHYPAVTRSIDVFPTLAGLASLRMPLEVQLDGTDLSGAILGERPAPELLAFSHTSTLGEPRVKRYHRDHLAMAEAVMPEAAPEHMWVRVREGDRIWETSRILPGPERTESFDLAADPGRENDLFDPEDAHDREMAQKLALYRRRLIANFQDEEDMSQREILDRLRGLGYVGQD